MHMFRSIVCLQGLASFCTAYAMPAVDNILGLAPRGDANDPCVESPSANASIQLASWVECQINGFFPYPANGNWDKVYADTFSKDLLASFNDTRFNYDGWLEFYHNINITLGQSFAPFKHGFLNTVAVPNANGDKGGFVYVLGWEGGNHTLLKRDLYFTDATFAVVKEIDGKRKITEFRESSNIPNTAKVPEPNVWQCGFE